MTSSNILVSRAQYYGEISTGPLSGDIGCRYGHEIRSLAIAIE